MAEKESGWTKEFPKVGVVRERYWIRNGGQLTILQVNPSGRHEVIGSHTKYLASDFNGWEFLGPISPSDAEQLMELRREAEYALSNLESDHVSPNLFRLGALGAQEVKNATEALRAVLNPQPEKETQGKMNIFKVAVFPHQGKTKIRYMAYTRDYNPQWRGCCEHEVEATNGTEAKAKAIEAHKAEQYRIASGIAQPNDKREVLS